MMKHWAEPFPSTLPALFCQRTRSLIKQNTDNGRCLLENPYEVLSRGAVLIWKVIVVYVCILVSSLYPYPNLDPKGAIPPSTPSPRGMTWQGATLDIGMHVLLKDLAIV